MRKPNPPLGTRPATILMVLATGLLFACSVKTPTEPKATVVSIGVTPGAVTLASFGESIELSVTALTASGTSVVSAFGWASSDPGVASVSASGSVTAVSDGVASIVATVAGVESNAVDVTVAQEMAAVVVTPSSQTVPSLGDTSMFSAEATDALGNAMDGFVLTWSSSNQAIATVDVDGNTAAVGPGTASIAATASGVSGLWQLVVDPVPVAKLEMPESASVGNPVSVDLRLLIAGYGNGIGASAFTLSFDPSVLQHSGSTSAYYMTEVADNVAGNVRLVASVPMGLTDGFIAATVAFDVVGGAGGTTDLDVSIDALIAPSTFADLTADGMGQTRSLAIQ
jgi:hypothetical protein